jgi:hypothetical protein
LLSIAKMIGDSMMDNMLLASALNSDVKKQSLMATIPDYVCSPQFAEFVKKVNAGINDNMGYMFLVLDKEWYRPGELVEGIILMDFFLPCF